MEILHDVSTDFRQNLMTNDVIDLCHDFYAIDFPSNIDKCETKLLSDIANEWVNDTECKTEAKAFTLEQFVMN